MKIHDVIDKFKNNIYVVTILKSLGAIALITAISVVSIHYMTGQTLSEYAEQNPELAYGTSSNQDSDATTKSSTVQSEASDTASVNSSNQSSDAANSSADAVTDNSVSPASVESQEITVRMSNMVHFYDTSVLEAAVSEADSAVTSGRFVYVPGFYSEPLDDNMVNYITGISFPTDTDNLVITYDDLRYIGILYKDFDGLTQAGEIICNKAIASDLLEIFSELYDNDYRLEKVVLIDNYSGDDTASMSADNTSCFNYRVVDNTTSLSNHAYGLAIDINPFYNPYIVYGRNDDGSDYISPAGSEIYADRSTSFAYKIDENDLCYRLFKEHGFKWGGDWNNCKDYQHFQKTDSIK